MPNLTRLRRSNALALFQQYAQRQLAAGEPAKGLEQAFAAALQVSPSMWSQVKASRPISDKLARQIEANLRQPAGWLDEEHEETQGPDPAEEDFVRLAREAWRAANAPRKRELRKWLAAGLPERD